MRPALLIVDVQRVYTDPDGRLHCADAAGTVGRINELAARCGERGMPVIVITHSHKSDGSDLGRMFDFTGDAPAGFGFEEGTKDVELCPELRVPRGALEIRKTRYSAFARTGLDEILRSLRVDTVVICGFMTNCCCESTARDAHDRDFFVDFIVDATGTPGTQTMDQAEIRRVVADLLANGFARVRSAQAYLATV